MTGQESASSRPVVAETTSAQGQDYTEQDVQLTGDAVHSADCGCNSRVHPSEHTDYYGRVAESVLAALAAAGRLLPEDPEIEYAVRWRSKERVVVDREAALYHLSQGYDNVDVIQRWVGPWVPVPTEPSRGYTAAEIDPVVEAGRIPCGECGPGYWIGDEACRHSPSTSSSGGEGVTRSDGDAAATPSSHECLHPAEGEFRCRDVSCRFCEPYGPPRVPVSEEKPLCPECAGAGWPDGIHACPACDGSGEEKP